MKWVLALLVSLSWLLARGRAGATAVLPPIDDKTAKGSWESIDWQSGTFLRLDIDDAGATLALSNGSPAADTVYRSDVMRVKAGALTFSGQERVSGLVVKGTGNGRAAGDIGVLRLTLRIINGNEMPWAGTELTFFKREKSSRLSRLVKAEAQAARLIHVASSTDQAGSAAKPSGPRTPATIAPPQ